MNETTVQKYMHPSAAPQESPQAPNNSCLSSLASMDNGLENASSRMKRIVFQILDVNLPRIILCPRDGMVDVADLKSAGSNPVPVQVRPWAPGEY